MSKHCYLCGKGKSLDNATPEWFPDKDAEIWCINQSCDVIHAMNTGHKLRCVVNDPWIDYVPPSDVIWHCGLGVPTGDHPLVRKYSPELLTGKWGSPTCMCALRLMLEDGCDAVTMVGFDSHFTGSRAYADCLGVKSDEIAPYHFYDTMMRRFAARHRLSLGWVDGDGRIHADDRKFRKCLVAVSMGDRYIRQTEGMIRSFLEHNPGWSVERFYDGRLESLLPSSCQRWSLFNKCEIGRWLAMQKCLGEYDTVLYADGDIRWYGKYESDFDHTAVLCPHYVTGFARNNKKHWTMKDGAANIGIIEMNRSIECDGVFDFIINEVLHNPPYFMHRDQLWLQNLVSTLPDCGYDAVYSADPGMDVASWNLRSGDREVSIEDGRYMVRTCTGLVSGLVSFHFSSKSLGSLVNYGDAVRKLLEDYQNEQ